MLEFWQRVTFAFRCFFSVLVHTDIPNDIVQRLAKPAAAAPQTQPPAASSAPRFTQVERPPGEGFDRAVQMLALLQRDGRLIDFLTENISPYPDEQLGAAARTIHEACRQVLERYLKLEPVLNSEEEQSVTVQAGSDPAAIRLIGNVTAQPPMRGTLRHKGWRVKEINLPPLPLGAARMVLAPAEVELP